MDKNDNDGRFPDDSRVEVRYPRTQQEEQGEPVEVAVAARDHRAAVRAG